MVRALLLGALAAGFLAAPATAEETCARASTQLMGLQETGGYREGLSLSPDGSTLAFFVRRTDLEADAYDYTLMAAPTRPHASAVAIAEAGGMILTETSGRRGGQALDRIPSWSPDGHWLAFIAERGGRGELWRVRPDGAEAAKLDVGAGDVRRFAWLPGSEGIVAETTRDGGELAAEAERAERDGFRIDAHFDATYALRPLSDRGALALVASLREDPPRPATTAEAALLDAPPQRSGAWVAPIDPASTAAEPAQAVFARDGAEDVARCGLSQCSGELRGAWRDGAWVYFLRGEGFDNVIMALYAWRPADNAWRSVWRGEAALRDCRLAQARLWCLGERSLQPRQVVSIDLARGGLTVAYDANPEWPYFPLTRVERIDVRDDAGNESFAYLVYPRGYVANRLWPMVVVQYRARGFLQGGTGGEYPIQAYAQCGYFVLSVERPDPKALQARLSSIEVMRQTELDLSEHTMKQAALDRLLDTVARRGLVDPSRIAITGLSNGSATVYWALTHSQRFAVAVASSPPTDPIFWSLTSEYWRASNARNFGMVGPDANASPAWSAWWRENAPINRLTDIDAPLLLQLGESEALMAMPLYTALREARRPVEAYLYPGAYHLKWRPRQVLAAQIRAMAWIDFWLRDVETPDPNDPDRATRWRALRAARHSDNLAQH